MMTVKRERKGLLLQLPNELLVHILRHFLQLSDLWSLYQTSSELRCFASTIIQTKWKIETRVLADNNTSIMKIQCRAALIALETLANQLTFREQYEEEEEHRLLVSNNSNKSISSSSFSIPDEFHNQSSIISIANFLTATIASSSTSLLYESNNVTSHDLIKTITPTNHKHHNSSKLVHLICQESRLHAQIIQGISSYKHKYVLIEDIDIRNRIRTAVDVIFHHAVFVSSGFQQQQQQQRALAAIVVRLLSRLDTAFPSYCREITYTLADNIKAFLEYTGYKLMSKKALTTTLVSIGACFDLLGAAYVGKILTDSHVDSAVQRICELLNNQGCNKQQQQHLIVYKKKLLTDLLAHWLSIKRELGTVELCGNIRLEIEKCT